VCFGSVNETPSLNGTTVKAIHADLSAKLSNLAKTLPQPENPGVSFMGDTKGGAFDIAGATARSWLVAPLNPNGRANSDVLRPWINGLDLTRRPRDMWIIDFGGEVPERDASLYEAPFEYAATNIKPFRVSIQERGYAKRWWVHERPRPEMWLPLAKLRRYICTPTVAKYRLFLWIGGAVCPDHQLIVIARGDDTTFGILHSRFHEGWSLRLGTWLGVGNDPRYTPTTTFETFPFPEGMTPNIAAVNYTDYPRSQRIAATAKRLDDLRRAWLNPPDLVDIVPEVTPTAAPGEAPRRYPDRIVPKNDEAAVKLKERTLTNLYNQRPRWLADAHEAPDRAVAAAYGWLEDISTDDALAHLLAVNLERAKTQ
jgi:type II restriction/modification system DNA methylase subunit YeeA